VLDFAGTVAIVATIVLIIGAFAGALPVRQVTRLWLLLVIGLWTGLAAALGAAGELADAGRRPVPLIGVLFATPLIAAALLAALSPAARRAMLSVPLPLLVGLNIPRLIGGLFLLLAAVGRLGGPFPGSAGWGDLITAVVAIPTVWLAARQVTRSDWLLHVWNAFGALDLFAAVILATISTPGGPLQLLQAGVGPEAMQFLPWALIPTVLVPYWLIAHGIIFAQLRARARS
jgi:hypothetical protein